MKYPSGRFIRSSAIGMVLLAWCAGRAAGADLPATVLSQQPVGYWRLSETTQPPAPSPAVNSGSLGKVADGQFLFGPKRGEPGALGGSAATSVRFFNPTLDPTFGGSKVEVPYHDGLNPNGPFSVEFWAKPSLVVTDAFCMVASLNSDPAIGARPIPIRVRAGCFTRIPRDQPTVNQWQFRLGNSDRYLDNDAIRGGTVTTGAWHHIVGTFNGSNAVPLCQWRRGGVGSDQRLSGQRCQTLSHWDDVLRWRAWPDRILCRQPGLRRLAGGSRILRKRTQRE